ncbi:5-oxoprolinase subunit B family protein [Cellulomonas sp. URHB0016]
MTDHAGVRVVPFGDDALLVEVADLAAVRRLDDALREARRIGDGPWGAVVDQVPAARTVLLRASTGAGLADLAGAVVRVWETSTGASASASASAGAAAGAGASASGSASASGRASASGKASASGRASASAGAGARADENDAPAGAQPPRLVTLEVVYDGVDLAEVADLVGRSVGEVVALHSAPTYTVAFGGFMPGFAYLVGLDPALRVPRRDSPRPRVPAGSVAIADEYSAVYPADTPGGWRLLGRCDATLFDVRRTPPALLPPGTAVRFVPTVGPA